MAQPKRHHHVAQHFQKRFADEDGRLHAYDKRRPEQGLFTTTPVNLFVEKDLYTIREKDGSRNTKLEAWYSELEGAVTPLIEHIIACCLAGEKPGLDADAKHLWDSFFYHQQKRAPDVFAKLGLEESFYDDLPRFIAKYEEQYGPLSEQQREEFKSPAVLRSMLEFARVRARSLPGEMVMDVLAQRGLGFAVTPANKAFIVGDHPQARLGGTDLNQGNVELWMPISSRVAVSPFGAAATETVYLITVENVRRINMQIFTNSNIVAARAPALIRSLAGI